MNKKSEFTVERHCLLNLAMKDQRWEAGRQRCSPKHRCARAPAAADWGGARQMTPGLVQRRCWHLPGVVPASSHLYPGQRAADGAMRRLAKVCKLYFGNCGALRKIYSHSSFSPPGCINYKRCFLVLFIIVVCLRGGIRPGFSTEPLYFAVSGWIILSRPLEGFAHVALSCYFLFNGSQCRYVSQLSCEFDAHSSCFCLHIAYYMAQQSLQAPPLPTYKNIYWVLVCDLLKSRARFYYFVFASVKVFLEESFSFVMTHFVLETRLFLSGRKTSKVEKRLFVRDAFFYERQKVCCISVGASGRAVVVM